jgi:hypothetical protein
MPEERQAATVSAAKGGKHIQSKPKKSALAARRQCACAPVRPYASAPVRQSGQMAMGMPRYSALSQ